VCRLLARDAPGVRVAGASRSGGAGTVRCDVRDERSLAPHVAGAALVVNAAGPYLYEPGPVVRACVAARAHYADLADDPRWLAAVGEAARAAGAEAAGVALVPGCSTVPGLVTLLAQRWASRAEVASLSGWLSLGSANPPSRGLVTSLLAPLGRHAPGGGRWFTRVESRASADGRRLSFGSWPAPATLALGARRVPFRFHAGFDRRALTLALRVAAPLLAGVPARSLPALAAAALPLARAARAFGTPHGALLLLAHDASGAELGRVELHARAHGLDIPAAPALWVAQRLLAGAPLPGGVRGLEAFVSREAAVAWLRGAGYELRE
jgi:hypothetical protein